MRKRKKVEHVLKKVILKGNKKNMILLHDNDTVKKVHH